MRAGSAGAALPDTGHDPSKPVIAPARRIGYSGGRRPPVNPAGPGFRGTGHRCHPREFQPRRFPRFPLPLSEDAGMRNPTRHGRPLGFTLIELLVVIAIIAILI